MEAMFEAFGGYGLGSSFFAVFGRVFGDVTTAVVWFARLAADFVDRPLVWQYSHTCNAFPGVFFVFQCEEASRASCFGASMPGDCRARPLVSLRDEARIAERNDVWVGVSAALALQTSATVSIWNIFAFRFNCVLCLACSNDFDILACSAWKHHHCWFQALPCLQSQLDG